MFLKSQESTGASPKILKGPLTLAWETMSHITTSRIDYFIKTRMVPA